MRLSRVAAGRNRGQLLAIVNRKSERAKERKEGEDGPLSPRSLTIQRFPLIRLTSTARRAPSVSVLSSIRFMSAAKSKSKSTPSETALVLPRHADIKDVEVRRLADDSTIPSSSAEPPVFLGRAGRYPHASALHLGGLSCKVS